MTQAVTKKKRLRILMISRNLSTVEFIRDAAEELTDISMDVLDPGDRINVGADQNEEINANLMNRLNLAKQRNFDLAIIEFTDFETDRMGLIERIQTTFRNTEHDSNFLIPIIWISTKVNVREAVTAMRLGAEDYFSLPLSKSLVQNALKRVLEKSRVYGENQNLASFSRLIQFANHLAMITSPRKVIDTVKQFLMREIESDECSILVYLTDKQQIQSIDETESLLSRNAKFIDEIRNISTSSSSGFKIMQGILPSDTLIARIPLQTGKDLIFLIPIRNQALSKQVIEDPLYRERLSLLFSHVKLSLAHLDQWLGAEKLAVTDVTTGLANARELAHSLKFVIEETIQKNSSFALLFLDIDHFKDINDSLGHIEGNRLLQMIVMILQNSLRESDRVYRFGGDEFVILLPQTDRFMAEMIADRLRLAVARTSIVPDRTITISIGVSLCPSHSQDPEELLKFADEAMYEAKKTRNTVKFAKSSNHILTG